MIYTSKHHLKPIALLTLITAFFFVGCRHKKQEGVLTIASTSSILDSGLSDEILNFFEKKHKCHVKFIAVGTGQALRLARDGNADVLLVHDKEAEEKFIAEGSGEKRIEIFRNDFVIVGPANDPAGAKKAASAAESFKLIAESGCYFVSRGDDSGTHKRELTLWKKSQSHPPKLKYLESGNGMIETLRLADEKSAYTLTDRATFLIHRKGFANIDIIMDKNGQDFSNPYSVIAVSPTKNPRTNYELAQKFISFITIEEGRDIIKNFGKTLYGRPLFIISN